MPRISSRTIALDTEDTGVDFHHGARPFFVTIAYEDGDEIRNRSWQWAVNPVTRMPAIPPGDLQEIRREIASADRIVGQNLKFDAHALATIGIAVPWDRVDDTLISGHLLASSQPHNLTAMVGDYLGIDIKPWEAKLEAAVREASKIAKRDFSGSLQGNLAPGGKVDIVPRWRIAKKGDPMMPSAKGKDAEKRGKGVEDGAIWRHDFWLPAALAKKLGYPPGHPWHTVLAEYSNCDSATTLALWRVMERELTEQKLWPLYRAKMMNLPGLYEMEERGATVIKSEMACIQGEYCLEIAERTEECLRIAKEHDYDLVIPKQGNNGSLTTFVFDVLRLPVVKHTKMTDKGGGGNPSFDKDVIEEYKKTLDGDQLAFIKALSAVRKRAKSNDFFAAYEKFGIPAPGNILRLHPSVNPTATATTRLSMSTPNLQQVSRQESVCEDCHGDGCAACDDTGEDLHSARKVFGPAPGREWWSADAKNIELRIPAYESGEEALIELFERPDDPPFYGSQHMLNMSIVYDDVWEAEVRAVGLEKVGPHCKKKYASTHYHWTKCGGLAMQYQCGEETADRTFRRNGSYARLKEFFANVGKLNSYWVDFAQRNGYVETIPDKSLGNVRGYPLLCQRNEWGRNKPTIPLNYHVQGTAGWWMVQAMNRCRAQLLEWRKEGFDGYMALTVHDEIVFDFPAAKMVNGKPGNLWRARILQKLMEQGGLDINIPTPVSLEHHAKSWAEGAAV